MSTFAPSQAGQVSLLRAAIEHSPIHVAPAAVAPAAKTFAEWCGRQGDIDAAILSWLASQVRESRRTRPVLM
jgi:hypothetical protein